MNSMNSMMLMKFLDPCMSGYLYVQLWCCLASGETVQDWLHKHVLEIEG